MKKEIQDRMVDKLKESGLSYGELSNITGLSKSTLQRYFTKPDVKIPINRIEIIARGLKCSAAYIMGWSDNTHLFSQNLNYLINYRELTIEKIVKDTGISLNKLDMLIKGYEDPSFNDLDKIAKYFDVSRDALLTEDITLSQYSNNIKQDRFNDVLNLLSKLNDEGIDKVIDYINDLSTRYFKQ